MDRRRFIFALIVIAVVASAGLVASSRGRDSGRPVAVVAAMAPVDAAPAGHLAQPTAVGPETSVDPTADAPAQLDAVRTVKLFCDLVDGRRLWSAAGLFASPRIWTRSQLRAVRSLSFRSARVFTVPDADTIVVAAVVRATTRAGSPVLAGTSTLFFTLGRVGTTSGGWLIAAVTASPQPQRKGSQ